MPIFNHYNPETASDKGKLKEHYFLLFQLNIVVEVAFFYLKLFKSYKWMEIEKKKKMLEMAIFSAITLKLEIIRKNT